MNTLRHVFPANRGTEDAQNDEIRIALRPLADASFEFRICDNGVGLPADFELHTLKTLGFKLINSIISILKIYAP